MLRLIRPFALAALFAAGCGGSSDAPAELPPAPPGASPPDCGLASFRDEALQQTNAARAAARSCGGTPFGTAAALAWNDRLARAAADHSRDMATRGYFDHVSPDGGTLGQRLGAVGYEYRRAGENIALGPPTVGTVMQGWLDSPGHCANIMDGRFTEVGLACVRNANNRPYWTMVLGTR